MQKIAVFPGTFDPITLGHVDIVNRFLPLFDSIIIAIGINTKKQTLVSIEKRIQWIDDIFSGFNNIKVQQYEGLTVEFCEQVNAQYILRGLRSGTDFDYESHIAQVNKKLAPQIETVFAIAKPELSYISSTIVRDLMLNNGDYSDMVSPVIWNDKHLITAEK